MFYLVFDKLILREISRHANTKYQFQPKKTPKPQTKKKKNTKPPNNLHILQYLPGMKPVGQNKRTASNTYTYNKIYFQKS